MLVILFIFDEYRVHVQRCVRNMYDENMKQLNVLKNLEADEEKVITVRVIKPPYNLQSVDDVNIAHGNRTKQRYMYENVPQ